MFHWYQIPHSLTEERFSQKWIQVLGLYPHSLPIYGKLSIELGNQLPLHWPIDTQIRRHFCPIAIGLTQEILSQRWYSISLLFFLHYQFIFITFYRDLKTRAFRSCISIALACRTIKCQTLGESVKCTERNWFWIIMLLFLWKHRLFY